MPLTATTPHAIRDALVGYIQALTPTEVPEFPWVYQADLETPRGSPRSFTVTILPSSQEFDGPWGANGFACSFDVMIEATYQGTARSQGEQMKNGDRRDLEKLVHPLTQHGAQGIAGLLPARDPVEFEDEGATASFFMPIRYWEAK